MDFRGETLDAPEWLTMSKSSYCSIVVKLFVRSSARV